MDRREAIKNVAFLMGGALSATTIAAVITGFAPSERNGNYSFSADHQALITEFADIILPDTKESQGARAAGVGPFIPMMLNDCYPSNVQRDFAAGIEELEQMSTKAYGKDFMSITRAEREKLVAQLREQTIATMAANRKLPAAQRNNKSYFFVIARDLTLLGFFSSEVGVTQAYRYVEIPGRYDGCVDLKPGEKLWA